MKEKNIVLFASVILAITFREPLVKHANISTKVEHEHVYISNQ